MKFPALALVVTTLLPLLPIANAGAPVATSWSLSSRIFTWHAAIGKPHDRNISGVLGSWSALRSTETG